MTENLLNKSESPTEVQFVTTSLNDKTRYNNKDNSSNLYIHDIDIMNHIDKIIIIQTAYRNYKIRHDIKPINSFHLSKDFITLSNYFIIN